MFNKSIVMGYVGRDPETSFTPQGNQYTKFTVGSTRKWRDANGDQKEETEWSNVITWNGLAEACARYLEKGRLVLVEGYLKTDHWTADGIQQRRTFIVATEVKFVPTSRPARPAFETEELPADLGQPQAKDTLTTISEQAPKATGRRRKQPAKYFLAV